MLDMYLLPPVGLVFRPSQTVKAVTKESDGTLSITTAEGTNGPYDEVCLV